MATKKAEKSLEETPTWAVAVVCLVFVAISILIERGIQYFEKLFKKRQNKGMIEALEKIKSELMTLGFISLLLTVGTRFVPDICISKSVGHFMLPCAKNHKNKDDGNDSNRRKLLSMAQDQVFRRILADKQDNGTEDPCGEGKESLISYYGIHQLHIFLFMLAIVHILCSISILALSQAKVKKWKAWEIETSSLEYEFTNDPSRFRFTHQTSFVKRHGRFSTMPGIKWIVAFFRQFFGSITKVDYITIRHGFINAHFARHAKFDFHKYVKRSMQDDFKVVVGISIPLWMFAITLLLLNVYNWYTLTWIALVPLIVLVLVGTKMEMVIMEMAEQIQEKTTVIRGAPVVQPSNSLFWFNSPQWILILIHFTSLQNAFQIALFLWVWYEFGLKSCLHNDMGLALARVILGVALQFMCSYITFPLYALVTQMGSDMKLAIFEEQTAKALQKWTKTAKERKKQRKAGDASTSSMVSVDIDNQSTISSMASSSPVHLLHKYAHRSSNAAPPSPDYDSPISSPKTMMKTFETETDPAAPAPQSDPPPSQRRDFFDYHHMDISFEKP